MNRTKIEWCDWTWNPIVGCSPESEGCQNCYAAAISKRFDLPWGKPVFMPKRLDELDGDGKPGRVFCGSMTDLGHPGVNEEWIKSIASTMRTKHHRTYIVLTKRPGPWLRLLPPSCWVGVSIENKNHYRRWTNLLGWAWPGCPVKFVSVEPMLGPVSFNWIDDKMKPDWVIAGPETGPKARPCEAEWIDKLGGESPCFFDKRKGATRREFPGVSGWQRIKP